VAPFVAACLAWALSAAPATAAPPPRRTEATVVPGAAYDSNLGVGFGIVSDVARYHPDFAPFKARLAAQLFLYLGPRPAGGVRVTYQHHYVKLDLPGLASDRLRLRFELRYRQQINGGYYGVGNAARDLRPWESIDKEASPEAWAVARRTNEYGFYKPEIGAQAQLRLRGPLSAYGELRLWWTWVDVLAASKLAEDLASGEPALGRLLVGAQRHGVLQGTVGLVLDTRDDETAPARGMLHEVSVRGGPTFEIPGGYAGLHIQTRFYASLVDDWLVVASRVMLDALVGQPPFLELSRFAGQLPDYGPGGATSVRGVPLQRYHGKIKVMGNVELRSTLVRFDFLKRRVRAGLIGFVDIGRVWADWSPQPALDGQDLGLAVGLGGGLRVQWGGTLMVRVDGAVSPDGVGVYFDVNHIF
jgi:hypothetical protein